MTAEELLQDLLTEAYEIDCVDLVDDPKLWRANRTRAANLIAKLRDLAPAIVGER